LSFNTIYPTNEFLCPFCGQAVDSGVGFRVGAICQKAYKVGDILVFDDGVSPKRPEKIPPNGNLKTVGYFNCDNPRCSSWQDCFPAVQMALITVKDGIIRAVENYDPPAEVDQFAIIEMD